MSSNSFLVFNRFCLCHFLRGMDILPPELERIISETPQLRRAFAVGGCVRDALLERPSKDFDIEVFGIDYEELVRALGRWGRTDLVGRSFGVVKLTTRKGNTYDFTIPRKDSKVAPGHKGFEIQFDPGITPQEAAARRDFTINAIMYDPHAHELLDFFGGAEDLRNRILRHTGPAFVEDPLRVLRGMQFAARFNLQAATSTLELCHSISGGYHELASDRVRDEWFKWAERSTVPSAGLHFLNQCGWIEHFPEIKALIDTPQEPEWHPEGDVFIHTCHCCDAMAYLPQWLQATPESRIVYMLAILAHDFGKPPTTHTELKDGKPRIVSPGHEEAGAVLAEQFLNRIHAPAAIQARVIPLVANHLFHFQSLTDRAVRRLARRLAPENIEGLCLVMTADSLGRPPHPPTIPKTIPQLLEKAHELQVRQEPPRPILMGRHLIERGLQPSPRFGEILHQAYEAQLEGVFADLSGALRWLDDWLTDTVRNIR